jgi:hypothetical protein
MEALLGFVCDALDVDASEHWQINSTAGGDVEPSLQQSHISPAADKNDIGVCRGMLASSLAEAAACTRENAWFGLTVDQQELLARAGVALRTVAALPCAPMGSPMSSSAVGDVIVLYSRHVLPKKDEKLNQMVSSLGAIADSARSTLSISFPPSKHSPSPRGTTPTSMGWLLHAAAALLQADVGELWTMRQPAGGAASMLRECGVASQTIQALPEASGKGTGIAEALQSFSSQLSRAAMYAAKIIWCNATNADGVLEGIKLPMQTAVGLPIWSCGRSCVCVLYSLGRCEQSPNATAMLSQLQRLASCIPEMADDDRCGATPGLLPVPLSAGASLFAPADSDSGGGASHLHEQLGSGGFSGFPVPVQREAEGACGGAAGVGSSVMTRNGLSMQWFETAQPLNDASQVLAEASSAESVMSTEQILSLIDSLGEDHFAQSAHVAGTHRGLTVQPAQRSNVGPTWTSAARPESPMSALPLMRSGCSGDLSALEL